MVDAGKVLVRVKVLASSVVVIKSVDGS